MSKTPVISRLVVAWLGVLAAGLIAGIWSYRLTGSPAFHAAAWVWLIGALVVGFWTLRVLQDSREALLSFLSEAVQQSRSGILMVRPDGRIEFANTGLCQQLGYSTEELLGRSCFDFRAPSVPEELTVQMLKEIRAGRSWEGEWLNQRKNGQSYPARGVVSPVRGRNGQPLGFIAVINDISAQQRHRVELSEAKEQAEAGNRAKGQFLATMSHEVRTPVHGIVGFTTLLLETSLSPEQREYVQTIRTSAEALVQLTGDILDFSRIESEGIQLEMFACDLRATVEDTMDMFAATAAEKGIELLHWVEPDVPAQVILDRGRVRQVLVNLVGNALKFTSRGEVEVQLRVLTGKAASIAPFDLAHPGQMVAEFEDGSLTFEFSVRDTGIGIAEEDRHKLFQPFSQLDVSSARKFGGAGLGLAISRTLVELMGGHIWFTSEAGRGSTFTFTIRARCAPPSESPFNPPPQLGGARIGLAHISPPVARELEEIFRHVGGHPVEIDLPDGANGKIDFIICDCTNVAVSQLLSHAEKDTWRPDQMIGLVNVGMGASVRQSLRPHFRILLNKPLHHRTFVDLLARAQAKTKA